MGDRCIGIDLGTTFSAVAAFDAHGYPQVLDDASGRCTIPSAVYLPPGGAIEVGEDALTWLGVEPERVARFFKRMMGDPSYAFSADGRTFSAVDLSAQILAALAERARERLGDGGPLPAVITVPAYFRDAPRRATIEAGTAAGLDVLCTVNEPTAAAIAYGQRHPDLRGRLVVYDLGGGTFDVTLLDYQPERLDVIATSGDHDLGGVCWDDVIIDLAIQHMAELHEIELRGDVQAMADLRAEAERAKIALSARDEVRLAISCGGKRENLGLTRAQFEEATADLLDRTRVLLVEMLKQSGVRWPDIDAVLLVGGSTRMPAVRGLLQTLAHKAPLTDINPDEAVALGAALRAQEFLGASGSVFTIGGASGSPRITQDVNSHSLGYVQESSDGHRYVNGVVIPRNTALGVSCERPSEVRTRPSADNTLEVIVVQGDSQRVLDNECVGAYRVHNIPHTTGTAVVDVSFGHDASGVVTVNARDRASGAALTVEALSVPDDLGWTDSDPADVATSAVPVFLTIDTSYSMSGSLLQEAKDAAIALIDQLGPGTQVGVAEFGGHTGVVMKPSADHDAVRAFVRSMSVGGSTPMGEALMDCLRHLAGQPGIIVLLTDGAPDDARLAEQAARTLKDEGSVIYTVGVAGAAQDLLKRLASSAGASFDPSSGGLVGTFTAIGRDIASAAPLKVMR